MIALRYGAIPVVPRVGGLADTVIDANEMALASGAGTGVQFSTVNREQLELALDRVLALARNRGVWRHLQIAGDGDRRRLAPAGAPLCGTLPRARRAARPLAA